MESQNIKFEGLAEELLIARQSAHGVKTGKVNALIGSNRLTILMVTSDVHF